MSKITFRTGERKGQTIDTDMEPKRALVPPGGTDPDTGKVESVDEAVDRMSGTPNKANQSSDAQNSY